MSRANGGAGTEKSTTTQQRILDEALTLFSQDGYSGVSVKRIADAVGIKDSSLYKHFKSKRAIFNTILLDMGSRMQALSEQLHIADASKEDASPYFASMSVDELVSLSEQAFLFYLKDPEVSRFRRMLAIEQYGDPEISQMYRKIFTEDSISYQTIVFSQLVDAGAFTVADPVVLAMNFYAPIFLLITRYDERPDKEAEALDLLDRHVREFYRCYTLKR